MAEKIFWRDFSVHPELFSLGLPLVWNPSSAELLLTRLCLPGRKTIP
ncbi:hypothetical protein JS781_004470 [Salmonella enterica subsp. enterica serovar Reading]|nr:hypothetical protein [Salmonella enterica subsp. enterica serovar Reading]EHC4763354.1 hypothetical protein [Salmonella enterica subsp. enterica serovar Reading]EHX6386463.1 hypothetical protein [Salmonella enterica subsp. enterica serovar Reading]